MQVLCFLGSWVFNRHDDCEIVLGGQDDHSDATCCCDLYDELTGRLPS